jgi:hypothetical protein
VIHGKWGPRTVGTVSNESVHWKVKVNAYLLAYGNGTVGPANGIGQ